MELFAQFVGVAFIGCSVGYCAMRVFLHLLKRGERRRGER